MTAGRKAPPYLTVVLNRLDDLRITQVRPLLPPAILLEEIPITERASELVSATRQAIANVLTGQDPRLAPQGKLLDPAQRPADVVEIEVRRDQEAERRCQRDARPGLPLQFELPAAVFRHLELRISEVVHGQPGPESTVDVRHPSVYVELVGRPTDQVAGFVEEIVEVAGRDDQRGGDSTDEL